MIMLLMMQCIKLLQKHTVYRRFGFTSEAFIRTDLVNKFIVSGLPRVCSGAVRIGPTPFPDRR